MKRLSLILIVFSICHVITLAQKPKVVKGEYTYYPPSTQSFDEARREALYRAQMQILADTYGTMMNMSSTTVVQNSGAKSDVDMFSLGESTVKGEWIETIGEPEFTTSVTGNGMLSIKVIVTGKVREIKEYKADFEVKVLRNGLEDKFENSEFQEGDDMFVSFRCLTEGYLTIYLYDGESSVYCLLPYQNQSSSVIETEAGRKYVFFSCMHADYGVQASLIDEYTLTCSKSLEMNRMYVVWSPDSFIKAMDSIEDAGMPRVLDLKSFQNWLSKLRVQNNKVAVKTVDIVIKKN